MQLVFQSPYGPLSLLPLGPQRPTDHLLPQLLQALLGAGDLVTHRRQGQTGPWTETPKDVTEKGPGHLLLELPVPLPLVLQLSVQQVVLLDQTLEAVGVLTVLLVVLPLFTSHTQMLRPRNKQVFVSK